MPNKCWQLFMKSLYGTEVKGKGMNFKKKVREKHKKR